MNANKTAVIINPKAGRNKARKLWPKISRLLEKHNIIYDSYLTDTPYQAQLLAGRLTRNGVKELVVVGGDGSLNEVINGVSQSSLDRLEEIRIGIIPAGTGNDFARFLGISRNSDRAVEIIKKGETRSIDLGLVNSRYFVNISGVGFDAQIAENIRKRKFSWVPGSIAYIYYIIKVLFRYKNIPLTITLDGESRIETNALMAAVGNTGFYGGGINIIPSAKPDDSYFHMCLVRDVTKFEILKTLPGIYAGKHIDHPLVDEYRAKSVYIDTSISDGYVPVHADGDVLTYLPAKFSISSMKLKLIAPAAEKEKDPE